MSMIKLDDSLALEFTSEEKVADLKQRAAQICSQLLDGDQDKEVKGWITPVPPKSQIEEILAKAADVRKCRCIHTCWCRWI